MTLSVMSLSLMGLSLMSLGRGESRLHVACFVRPGCTFQRSVLFGVGALWQAANAIVRPRHSCVSPRFLMLPVGRFSRGSHWWLIGIVVIAVSYMRYIHLRRLRESLWRVRA